VVQRCGFAHHPRGDVRERAIWLSDDQDFDIALSVTPGDRHHLAMARVERIEDPSLSVLIPGSMSLLRLAPARPIYASLSPRRLSAPTPEGASSTSSIWSTSSSRRKLPAAAAASPRSCCDTISSQSTSSAICPSASPEASSYST